jgi:hypothetical protein
MVLSLLIGTMAGIAAYGIMRGVVSLLGVDCTPRWAKVVVLAVAIAISISLFLVRR